LSGWVAPLKRVKDVHMVTANARIAMTG
jgi:hypothetical protein